MEARCWNVGQASPVPPPLKQALVRHERQTLRSAALIPEGTNGTDGQPFPTLPDDPLDDVEHVYEGGVPVIVGHYWETGTPKRYGPKVACVDYSAGKGGPLVAYRWNEGDADLTDDKFVSF